MLNLKLKTIASLISKDDIVIDVACDHAYLAIYLKENNLCQEVYASDISASALKEANKNITQKKLAIKTYLSDGFNNIPKLDINTIVIAGVGTNTILDILKNTPQDINKIILSSNNDYELLRHKMLKKGFYILKEIVIKDHNKYYPIMLFTTNKQKETKLTLKYGKSSNQEYYTYLLNKKIGILNKLPKNKFKPRLKLYKEIWELKYFIKKTLDY